MSLNDFSVPNNVVTVNGRQLKDWGETDPPVDESPIDPKRALRRGLGGNAAKLERSNPGRQVTISLNPGGPDSAYMQQLFNSGATITYTRTQIGTLEGTIGAEGVIVNDGPTGRGGMTITDDQYIIEFNTWNGSKGGS